MKRVCLHQLFGDHAGCTYDPEKNPMCSFGYIPVTLHEFEVKDMAKLPIEIGDQRYMVEYKQTAVLTHQGMKMRYDLLYKGHKESDHDLHEAERKMRRFIIESMDWSPDPGGHVGD